jgi:hypothetical protein
MELNLDEAPNIHVCTVMPPSVDTPLFHHTANYTGRRPKAMNHVYSAETVAKAVVDVAEKPKREVLVGNAARMMAKQANQTPAFYERAGAKQIHQEHFDEKPAAPTEGNLFKPMPQHTGVSGGWPQTAEFPVGKVLMAAGAILLALLWLFSRILQYRQERRSRRRGIWNKARWAGKALAIAIPIRAKFFERRFHS